MHFTTFWTKKMLKNMRCCQVLKAKLPSTTQAAQLLFFQADWTHAVRLSAICCLFTLLSGSGERCPVSMTLHNCWGDCWVTLCCRQPSVNMWFVTSKESLLDKEVHTSDETRDKAYKIFLHPVS